MIVEVISKEVIKPSIPTPNHLKYHNLSLFDRVNGPILMPTIFFYSINRSLNPDINTMVTRLNESLFVTLTKFYPLAGQVTDQNHVICNDEGVPYVQTRVNRRLNKVVDKAEVRELDKLLPCKPHGPSTLILTIQVNVFECGGIAIGICMNHKVCDAFSILMFINTWSIIARGDRISESSCILPRFDGAKLFPSTNNLSKFSRIVATSKSITNNVPYEVCQAVSVRSKINYFQEKSFYFGNLYVNAIAKPLVTTDNGSKMYREIIELIRDATKKIDSTFMVSVRDGTQDLDFVTDHFERAKKGKIVSLGFSSYGSLPLYESDFGWGKPVWVTSATLAMKNVIILIPSHFRTQVDAYVCLSEESMRNLECDQEFTLFAKKSLCSKL
ncbi:stemmadenine O-acetyltransferase-like [Silene latifolia]|uniref:stemmadenine O-acetyltransferase-like n=1 Tax=Silene latifolia TaxID=37657 RepID=UPI003D775049